MEIVNESGLCSKTRPRLEFTICAKMENLELFRKWYGFSLKMKDCSQFYFRKEFNIVFFSSCRAN